MLLLKIGPKVPSRAQRAPPALRRSEKEGGHRPPEPPHILKTIVTSCCQKALPLHPNSGICVLTPISNQLNLLDILDKVSAATFRLPRQ